MLRFSLPIFCLFLSVSSYAETSISYQKGVGVRYLVEIGSLTKGNLENKTLTLANPKDGYFVEVERNFDGNAGLSLDLDEAFKKFESSIGIDFTSGFTFTNSKKVKDKNEIDSYVAQSAMDYFKADTALKMAPDEEVKFVFNAGVALSPNIPNQFVSVGAYIVASGGWDIKVKKINNESVEINFSLLNANSATIYAEKFGASISVDLARQLESGYILTLNLNDSGAKEAYQRLFKGNILFAQDLAKKNKNIIFKNEIKKSKNSKGHGLSLRTPMFNWFLLNSTHHMISGENSNLVYETNKTETNINSSYEEESKLDFLSTYHGVLRKFEINYNLESKKYSLNDLYEIESNVGRDLPLALYSMKNRTMLDQYFSFKYPSKVKNKYFHILLSINYTEEFLKHVSSKNFMKEYLNLRAKELLNKYYESQLKILETTQLDPSGILIERQLESQKLIRVLSKIKLAQVELQRSFLENNPQEVINQYTKLMKVIYSSRFFYKVFVDYSRHCGSSINFELNSEAFAKLESKQNFIKDQVCN